MLWDHGAQMAVYLVSAPDTLLTVLVLRDGI